MCTYYGLLLHRQSVSQDRSSFFDSRDDCQVAWSEIINHRVWHVSWPYSPSNILTVSQFAIMHFRSLCVSDTHLLEPARAEVDIDSLRGQTRKSRISWDAKMEPVTMMTATRDGTMSRAIEKSRESGTRQRMCKRMPKNLYLLRIQRSAIRPSVSGDFRTFKDVYFPTWNW